MEDNSHDGLETQPALTKEQVSPPIDLIQR
jgi:hypothetical protein